MKRILYSSKILSVISYSIWLSFYYYLDPPKTVLALIMGDTHTLDGISSSCVISILTKSPLRTPSLSPKLSLKLSLESRGVTKPRSSLSWIWIGSTLNRKLLICQHLIQFDGILLKTECVISWSQTKLEVSIGIVKKCKKKVKIKFIIFYKISNF